MTGFVHTENWRALPRRGEHIRHGVRPQIRFDSQVGPIKGTNDSKKRPTTMSRHLLMTRILLLIVLCGLAGVLRWDTSDAQVTSKAYVGPRPHAIVPLEQPPAGAPKKKRPKKTVEAPPKSAAKALKEAKRFTKSKKWADAARVLTEAHGAFPDNAVILNELGYVLYKEGKRLREASVYLADAYFKGMDQGDGFLGEVRYNQGLVAIALGQPEEALRNLDSSLSYRSDKRVERVRDKLLSTPANPIPYETVAYASITKAREADDRIDGDCENIAANLDLPEKTKLLKCLPKPGNLEPDDEGRGHAFLGIEREGKVHMIPLVNVELADDWGTSGGLRAGIREFEAVKLHTIKKARWLEVRFTAMSESGSPYCEEAGEDEHEVCTVCNQKSCESNIVAIIDLITPNLLAIVDTEWSCTRDEECLEYPDDDADFTNGFAHPYTLKGTKLEVGKKSYELGSGDPIILPGRNLRERQQRISSIVSPRKIREPSAP